MKIENNDIKDNKTNSAMVQGTDCTNLDTFPPGLTIHPPPSLYIQTIDIYPKMALVLWEQRAVGFLHIQNIDACLNVTEESEEMEMLIKKKNKLYNRDH